MEKYQNSSESKQKLSTVNCPYCFSKISFEAEVCSYCTRDVGRLIRAEKKLKEIESKINKHEVVQLEDISTSPIIRPIIFSFYLITITFNLLQTYQISFFIDIPSYTTQIIAFIIGVVIVIYQRDYNIWKFFLIGFVQPIISIIIFALYANIKIIQELPIIGAELFQHATFVGTAGALGILIASFFYSTITKQPRSSRLLSLSVFTEWIYTSESRLERIEKFILKVIAIITPIISIISKII